MRRLEIKHLWERHKEVARLLVSGRKHVEVAATLGMTPARVAIIANSPVFEKYLDRLRDRVEVGIVDVREKINEGSKDAIQVLLGMLKASDVNPQTKSKVAMDILDRAGFAAVKTVRSENLNVTLNAERLQELKDKRDEMLQRSRLEHNVIEVQVI
jgi:hypothetical protein